MNDIGRLVAREVNEVTKRQVMLKAMNGEITRLQAAEILRVSERHTRRIRRARPRHHENGEGRVIYLSPAALTALKHGMNRRGHLSATMAPLYVESTTAAGGDSTTCSMRRARRPRSEAGEFFTTSGARPPEAIAVRECLRAS
jgi:hypothetical protein